MTKITAYIIIFNFSFLNTISAVIGIKHNIVVHNLRNSIMQIFQLIIRNTIKSYYIFQIYLQVKLPIFFQEISIFKLIELFEADKAKQSVNLYRFGDRKPNSSIIFVILMAITKKKHCLNQ